MTVRVDKMIFRALALRGLPDSARAEINTFLASLVRNMDQLRERTGGSTDTVAEAASTAATAAANSTAANAGVTVPTPGGSVELTPSNPLSYSPSGTARASIVVAGHTRTGAGAALVGATITPTVARGETYYVYYNDPANAGGAVTYVAAVDLTSYSSANDRIVGTIYIPPMSYDDREV